MHDRRKASARNHARLRASPNQGRTMVHQGPSRNDLIEKSVIDMMKHETERSKMMFYLNKSSGKLMDVKDSSDARNYDESEEYQRLSPEEHDRLVMARDRMAGNLKELKRAARGKRVHVLGNGPSLKDFPGPAKGDLVIGVNAAGLAHDLDYWVILDDPLEDIPCRRQWLSYARRSPSRHVMPHAIAMRMCNKLDSYEPYASFARICDPDVLENGLFWDRSSVHAALDLARNMGAVEVNLWGVDYEDRSHFYSGEEAFEGDPYDNPGKEWTDLDRHIEGFRKLSRYMGRCRVLNCNPRSMLGVFDKAEMVIRNDPPRKPTLVPEVELVPPEVEINPFKFVRAFTFYTLGTPYENLAQRCVSSFRSNGMEVNAIPFKGTRSWMGNCMRRQEMLKSLMSVYSNVTIALLDSDLVCLKKPIMLADFATDVALHHRPHLPEEHEFCAGLVVVKPSPKGREFVDNWARITKENKKKKAEFREQLYLKEAVMGTKGLTWTDLGEFYNRKPEHFVEGDNTVILHDVASRKTRKELS